MFIQHSMMVCLVSEQNIDYIFKIFEGPADYTYLILGSDYFQYSLVWYCYDIAPNQSQEFSTVFSRTPDLPPPQRQRVDELIQLHLNSDFMRPTEQADEVCSN